MLPSRLHRLRRRAQLTLWWERAYAIGAPVACVLAGWAILALLGVWSAISPWVHLAGLALTVFGAVFVGIFSARRLPRPEPRGATARVEHDSAFVSGLVGALADRPISGAAENPLWRRHQADLAAKAAAAKLDKPRPLISVTDPLTIRLGAAVLLAAALVFAGGKIPDRLQTGLAPEFTRTNPLIANIWITPPEYTGQPPIFLVRSAGFEGGTSDPIDVPIGAEFSAQISRTDGGTPRLNARLATATSREDLVSDDGASMTRVSANITENAAVELRAGGRTAIFPMRVVPDEPPTIRWQNAPETEGGTRTILSLDVEDDFGVASAELMLFLPKTVARPPDAPKPKKRVSSDQISVPALRGPPGKRTLDLDLTEHPWAGLPVEISIHIKDGAGHSARTERVPYELPVRVFYNPLARAVVEQRQSLSIAPTKWQRSARIFDAVTFAPAQFSRSGREYLLVRAAYHQVINRAASEPEAVVESLWPLAMSLEDEPLSQARQRLEAAQAALRDALARGASQSEIDALIEDLRLAMAEYMAALAASDNAPTTEQAADVDSMDLQDILDEIAELRRNGDTEAARRRLNQLEELLRNLQISTASSGGGGQGGSSPGGSGEGEGESGDAQDEASTEGLSGVGNLIRQQRDLSDETFGARREDRSTEGLAEKQRQLAEAANALATPSETTPTNEKADIAFGRALQAMQAAADAIDRGELALAQGLQEQAIEALRDGGQEMAAAARAAEAESDGNEGEDQTAGQRGDTTVGSGLGEQRDPLGRAIGPYGATGVEIPELSDPERVRELTDELRRRLSDPSLKDEERTYIERLLERF